MIFAIEITEKIGKFCSFFDENFFLLLNMFFLIWWLKEKASVRGIMEENFKFFCIVYFRRVRKNFFSYFGQKIGAKSWIKAFLGGKGPSFLPLLLQSYSYCLHCCRTGWNYLKYTRMNRILVFFYFELEIFLSLSINKSPNIG